MVKNIQYINPTGLYDPSTNGYTHAIVVPPGATMVYISGQGGEDENGNLANNFTAQLKQAFANLCVALSATGAGPEHVVKLTSLVVAHDESKVKLLASEVLEIWGKQTPAHTLIPVPRLALDGMLFEVDAIAAIPSS